MSIREDVKYILNKDWHPEVPRKETIMKQAKIQIKNGKSTGNVTLDIKAIKSMMDEEER